MSAVGDGVENEEALHQVMTRPTRSAFFVLRWSVHACKERYRLTDENDFAQPALASSGPVWTAPPTSFHETWKYARHFQAGDAPFSITSPPTLLAATDSASTSRLAVDDAVEPSSATHVRALRQEVDVPSSVIKFASDVLPEDLKKSRGASSPLVVIPFKTVPNRFDPSRALTKCLVLRAGGLHGNQLIVGILQPSAPWRNTGAAAFLDYGAYEQEEPLDGQKLTRSVLERRAAEQAARIRAEEHATGSSGSAFVNMTTSESVLHQFPSPICSLHLAPESGELLKDHRVHSKNWLCIRTVTSTVFASVRVQARALWDEGRNLSFIELWGLLEISHGESAVLSGIKGHRSSKTRKWTDISVLSSPCRIVDIAFHPHRRETALTIDATGSLGRFECDFFSVLERGWRNSTTWSLSLANPSTAGQHLDDAWTVDWDSGGETCLVAHPEGVWDVRLTDGARRVVYDPDGEAEVISISTSTEPNPILWIATTNEVLALDLRAHFAFQRLASCAHNRLGGDGLHIDAVRHYPERNIALLSSSNDALVSTYALQIDGKAPIATWDGDPGVLQTGALQSACRRSSFPLLMNVSEMDEDWCRAMQNRVDCDNRFATFAVLETTREGGLWITGACAVHRAAPHLPFDPRSNRTAITKDRQGRNLQRHADALTLRTVHSLGGMYRYLFSSVADVDERSEQKVPRLLSAAARWLRQQSEPLSLDQPAVVLARDVLSAGEGLRAGSSRMVHQPRLMSTDEDDFVGMQTLWSANYAHLVRDRQGNFEGQRTHGTEDLLQTIVKVTKRYAVDCSVAEAADGQTRTEAVNRNLGVAAREMMIDMALSACPLSKHTYENGDDRNSDHSSSLALRPLFTPAETSTSKSKMIGSRRKAPIRMPITAAARSLLEEWPLGHDPTEYHYAADDQIVSEEEPFDDGVRIGSGASKRSSRQRGRRLGGSQMPLASDDFEMPPPLAVQSRQPLSDDRAYDAASSDPLQPQSMSDPFALDPSLRDMAWQSQSNAAPFASQASAVQSSQKARKKRRVGGF